MKNLAKKIKLGKDTRTVLIFYLLFVIIFSLGKGIYDFSKSQNHKTKSAKTTEVKKESKPKVVKIQKPVIKESALLTVPYTVQAPLVNWNIHEESCEEAALLMIHYYLAGSQLVIIPPVTANQELVNMRSWQISHYGSEKDLNMYRTGKLAQDYYGYKYEVTEDVTADNIKLAISEGNPVLVPVITHALLNPHYGRQPSYHILVIKGYYPGGIITNDAGVKEGRSYFYTWDILWQAIDAQTKQMNQGRDMLVVTK